MRDVVLGTGLDVGPHVQRQDVGRSQVDRGVVLGALDAGQLMQDDRALGIDVQGVAHTAKNDPAALLQTALQVEIERVVVAGHFDAAERLQGQAGGPVGRGGPAGEDEDPAVKNPGVQVIGHGQTAIDDRHWGKVESVGQGAPEPHAQRIIDADGGTGNTGQAGPRAIDHLDAGATGAGQNVTQRILDAGAQHAAVCGPTDVVSLVTHAVDIEL